MKYLIKYLLKLVFGKEKVITCDMKGEWRISEEENQSK